MVCPVPLGVVVGLYPGPGSVTVKLSMPESWVRVMVAVSAVVWVVVLVRASTMQK